MAVHGEFEEILSNYESHQLVKKQFYAKHALQLNTATAQEIAATFRQARGYIETAASADRNVRPLLAYYAVLGYSRALTLFLRPGLREAGLSQSHGLSVEGWGAILSADGGNVSDLRIKFNAQGTLQQLIEATAHESFLRNNSSVPNFRTVMDVPAAGAEVTLGEVLARIPEIHATYLRWRDDRVAIAVWPQGKADDGSKVRVDPPFDERDWVGVFGDLPFAKEGRILTGIITNKAQANTTLSDVTGGWKVGTIVSMRRFNAGIELSKITTAFLASYALGMLVRYYPSHWMSMLYGQKHDAALPTLLATLSHVSEEFPRFVVEFLERRPA